MSPEKLSLVDAVDQTLRQVIPELSGPKSVFNLSAQGPLALDGVLPVILPRDDRYVIPAAAGALGIDPFAIFEPSDPSDLSIQNRDYFQQPLDPVYEDYIRETSKIYSATLGIRFDLDASLSDFAASRFPAALIYGSVGSGLAANEGNFFGEGRNASGSKVFGRLFEEGGFVELSRVLITPSWKNQAEGFWGASPYANYAFGTFVHETGHSLGLMHPGTYNGELKNVDELIWLPDSIDESVMSYVSQVQRQRFGLLPTWGGGDKENPEDQLYSITPRVLDFLALDRVYGGQETSQGQLGVANAFVGDTVYGFNTSISPDVSEVYADMAALLGENALSMTLVDGGGIDTIDLSGYDGSNRLDLTILTGNEYESRYSSLNGTLNNLSLAVGTVIENAIGGSADDTFWDNSADNVLEGREGDDRFYLTTGLDEVIGGEGFDVVVISGLQSDYQIQTQLIGGSGGDGGSAGNVTVGSIADPAVFTATLTSVEQVIFQGDGTVLDL